MAKRTGMDRRGFIKASAIRKTTMIYAAALLTLLTPQAINTTATAPEASLPIVQSHQDFDNIRNRAISLLDDRPPAPGDSDHARPIHVEVDERMALLGVIFKLAGADEFSGAAFRPYADYVQAYFAHFLEHGAVQFAKRMRSERGIGPHEVAGLALHLGQLPEVAPPTSFAGLNFDPGWSLENAKTLADLARDFARKSDFRQFLSHAEPVHRLLEHRARSLVHRDVSRSWYSSYLGVEDDARFRLVISPLNGPIGYGIRVQEAGGPVVANAVIGTYYFDSDGLPVYDGRITGHVVHEFLHSFIDPAVTRRQADFKDAAAEVGPALARYHPPMAQFYWKTLFEESIIRAIVIRYLQERLGVEAGQTEVIDQLGKGFLWLEDLAQVLEEYEGNRQSYPTIEEFMPRIATYFRALPGELPTMVEKLDAQRPQVISTTPSSDAQDVPQGLAEIRVTFDRPMMVSNIGVLPPLSAGHELPEIIKSSFSDDGKVLILKVKLKSNQSYELRLNSNFATTIRSAEGIPLRGHSLRFRTGTGCEA